MHVLVECIREIVESVFNDFDVLQVFLFDFIAAILELCFQYREFVFNQFSFASRFLAMQVLRVREL